MIDTQKLGQALVNNLAKMSVGTGGDPDVFSPELDKQVEDAAINAVAAGLTVPGADAADEPRGMARFTALSATARRDFAAGSGAERSFNAMRRSVR